MARPAEPHIKRQSEDIPQSVPALSEVSDIIIARAVAAAVRATPGIAGLSPGLLALAATYGPNERVVGVVLRHFSPHDTVVEVHVVVGIETIPKTEPHKTVSDMSAPAGVSDGAVLIRVANQVRNAVYRAIAELNLPPPSAVDVLIDDIRLPA
ncbi:MAG TPA: hypothetical protein VFU63_13305 [Ktedonobacterales bacterium]|nr:hypothetical protein [Ktedonobacterales bacterium]